MYLLYVDESGDTGIENSPTDFFILNGLVVHELHWESTLSAIVGFRKSLRDRYGLKLREEIHASSFLQHPGELSRIDKHVRLRILRDVIDFQASLPSISIMNVVVSKAGKPIEYDLFTAAWKILVQRFHNTISHNNFPGPGNPVDHGLIVADKTDEVKLRSLVRMMRRFNPVPSMYAAQARTVLLDTIVEDPIHRDSKHSYFIQLADVNAYMLHQKLNPCGYIRKKGGRYYFDRLDPVLCKVASRTDTQGIVMI